MKPTTYKYDAATPGVWYYPPPGWEVAAWENFIRPFGKVILILRKEGDDSE